jgi:RNA recognition motif-containing protein
MLPSTFKYHKQVVVKNFPQKSNKRSMAGTITKETKKEGQRMHNPQEPKKRRKQVPLMVGNYFTHSPSNVTCMQIVRYNSNERSRTSITRQHNFPLYSKG